MGNTMSAAATEKLAGGSVFLAPDRKAGRALISQILNNPREISNLVASHTESSLAVRIFGGTQTFNTGTAYFTELKPENLAVEGVKARAEGSEYPMVQITPPDLKGLENSDIGGKFRVTDEAREEGVTDVVGDGISLIARTLTDVLDDMSVTALVTATEATGSSFTGNSWLRTVLTGPTPTPPMETPAADLITAQARLANNGLRAVGNVLVLNPVDESNLKIVYGSGYSDLLDSVDLEVVTSPKVPLNVAFVLDRISLGGLVSKSGLVTEIWRDHKIRSTWVQTYIEPAVYITRPSNIVRIDNIFTEGD